MAPISVIIVGAGPSGLLLARLLAQSGVRNIKLLERDRTPTHDYRAVFYQAISIHEFKRAGILQDVEAAAHPLKSVCWRDAAEGGKRLFGMPGGSDTLLMSVNTLTGIIRRHLSQKNQCEMLTGHDVVDAGQEGGKAWVDVETPQGRQRMEASYVVACDGAQSTVRKSVFGSGAMEGFTWDRQLVAADIRCDPSVRFPDVEESNLFIHPTDAWILFYLPGEEHMWRVIYQDTAATDDELVANAKDRIGKLLASDAEAPPFEIISARPYRIHQRLVTSMVKGRIILAADAAHLCCPYGALGLNGGIADVGSLADCLAAINDDKADESILDVYNSVRREKWQNHIDPTSQRTMKTIYSAPSDLIPDHPLYKMCKMFESNPDAMKGRPGPDPLALRYDFTPHFKQA